MMLVVEYQANGEWVQTGELLSIAEVRLARAQADTAWDLGLGGRQAVRLRDTGSGTVIYHREARIERSER